MHPQLIQSSFLFLTQPTEHELLQLRFTAVSSSGLEQAARRLCLQLAAGRPQVTARRIITAGGGGIKFAPMFRDVLGVELVPFKELQVKPAVMIRLVLHICPPNKPSACP